MGDFTAAGAVNDDASSIVVEGEGCVAVCYHHANYGGWAAEFEEGRYDMSAFMAAGAKNDDMSSLKVFRR